MPELATAARRIRLLPEGATDDAAIVLVARGIRAFGDGFVSVLLPVYLTTLGLSATRLGSSPRPPCSGRPRSP